MTEAELMSAKKDAYQSWVESLVQLMRENFTKAMLAPAQRPRPMGLRVDTVELAVSSAEKWF